MKLPAKFVCLPLLLLPSMVVASEQASVQITSGGDAGAPAAFVAAKLVGVETGDTVATYRLSVQTTFQNPVASNRIELCLRTAPGKPVATRGVPCEADPYGQSSVKVPEKPSGESSVQIQSKPSGESSIRLPERPSGESSVRLPGKPSGESSVVVKKPAGESSIRLPEKPSGSGSVHVGSLTLTKSATQSNLKPGDRFTLHYTVSNDRRISVSNLNIIEALPAYFVPVNEVATPPNGANLRIVQVPVADELKPGKVGRAKLDLIYQP